jgi:hypothetical protein
MQNKDLRKLMTTYKENQIDYNRSDNYNCRIMRALNADRSKGTLTHNR